MESILKTEADLKRVFKDALIEALEEKKDLFNDLFREISEDIALAKAIEEGENSTEVSRSAVFDLLEQKG